MWTFLLGFLNFLPSIERYLEKRVDAKVQEFVAQTGASRDIAVAAIQAQQAVQVRWWFVAIIPPAFAIPFVIWTWVIVVWDSVLGLGSHEAIRGDVGTIYMMVVGFYFLHGMSKNA
jgi:hypothetical protein